jgi:hypothetical protein
VKNDNDDQEVIPMIYKRVELSDDLDDRLADRYIDGYAKYGVPMQVEMDYDWVDEGKQELDDFMVYAAAAYERDGVDALDELIDMAIDVLSALGRLAAEDL